MGQAIKTIDDLKNNETLYKILKNSIDSNKISHAYIVESSNLEMGLDLAKAFAKSIYGNDENICNLIEKEEFIDLEIIRPIGLTIKKEQIDYLINKYSTKSLYYKRRVYIIYDASLMNKSSSNALLKFLEEPYPNITAILVVNNVYNLLDTIKSRCILLKLNQDIKEIYNQEISKKILEFTEFHLKNKLKTILYTDSLWHKYHQNKESNDIAFTMLMYLYKDILNYKIKRKLEYFDIEDVKKLESYLDIQAILERINIIIDVKNRNMCNANLKLNLDNMLIEMEN